MSFAEALRQKRPGRIHDLAPEVEHTEDVAFFDVDKEIGEREWKIMEGQFRAGIADPEKSLEGLAIAAHIKLLDEDRFAAIAPEVDRVLKTKDPGTIVGKSDILSLLILDREWIKTWLTEQRIRESTVNRMSDFSRKNSYFQFAKEAEHLALLTGGERLDDHWFEVMWPEITKVIHRGNLREVSSSEFYCDFLACVRVFAPERWGELAVSSLTVNNIRSLLDTFREFIFINSNIFVLVKAFAKISMDLKIITAEEVKVTEQGIEITMPREKKRYKEETPKRPERLNF